MSRTPLFSLLPLPIFKIMGSFSITSPNAGEVWVVAQTRNITWTTVGSISNVNLAYSMDGGSTYPNTVALNAPNTGSYSWTIPDSIGTTLRMQITDAIDSDAVATSAGNFKIEGSITVTAPTSGNAWIVASTQNITWTIVGSIANVTIDYSTERRRNVSCRESDCRLIICYFRHSLCLDNSKCYFYNGCGASKRCYRQHSL